MRRVRYNVATSLDGFIDPPNGSTDWILHDPTIDFVSLYAEFDKFTMSRKTYEYMFSLDKRDNPLHGKRREDLIVVSRRMQGAEYPGVTVVDGEDVVGYVTGLKGEGERGKDIWLFGGGELARSLLEAGVVDAVEVVIMPVILGDGVKMVAAGEDGESRKPELGTVKRLDSGILMCKYTVSYDG